MRKPRHWGTVASVAVASAAVLLVAACGDAQSQAEGWPSAAGLIGGANGAANGNEPGTTSSTAATSVATPLATGHARTSPGVVGSGGPAAPYDYAPTVMKAGGQYRMWWCSQLPAARPGDQILYAESASANGPFAAPGGAPAIQVYGNSPVGFDSLHTCDPSVIAVNGTYYLYYTGTSDAAGAHNAIGLATSTDGVNWTRANDSQPIVTAAGDVIRKNGYGVGQPSVVFLNDWYYLMFTDTTGEAADASGAGQFVLRSPDPAFGYDVEALGPNGYGPGAYTAAPRLTSVADANSADLTWSDALNAFAIAQDTSAGTVVTFWDVNFGYHPYQSVLIPGPEQEGPGIVRQADGHIPADTGDPCGTVPLDVVRATSAGAGPLGLEHFGLDLEGVHGCQTTTQAIKVLNGFAMPSGSPSYPADLIVNGRLVQVERRSVAEALAEGMLDKPVALLAKLPVATQLDVGAAAVTAPGRPVGLLLTGQLWTVGRESVATDDSSPLTTITAAQWDAYPRGGDLSGLRY